MKVSKRSLIVSIAVLCVCALSLTAASFAWFSQSQKATVTDINLTVKRASDLQVSIDGSTWLTTVKYSDDEFAISDASTNDGSNFWAPANPDSVDIDTGAYNGTYTTKADGIKTVTVYFRSSSPVNVRVAMDAFAVKEGQNNGILDAMRMVSKADDVKFFANDAGSDDVVSNAAGTTAEITLNGANTATDIIAALSDTYNNSAVNTEEGYYYGEATFTFYVEGTDAAAINANTGVSFVQGLTFDTTYVVE